VKVADVAAFAGQGRLGVAPTRFGDGSLFVLGGTSNIPGFGTVAIAGRLHLPQDSGQGQVTGLLTFSNSAGSITLQLVAPAQPGSPVPGSFQYQVVASAGSFHPVADQGTVQLGLSFRNWTFSFNIV
jgi:hypothetical protein